MLGGRNLFCKNQQWHLKGQANAHTPPCGVSDGFPSVGPQCKNMLTLLLTFVHSEMAIKCYEDRQLQARILSDCNTWLHGFENMLSRKCDEGSTLRLGSQLECPLKVHHLEQHTSHSTPTGCVVIVDRAIFWVSKGLWVLPDRTITMWTQAAGTAAIMIGVLPRWNALCSSVNRCDPSFQKRHWR